MRARRRAISILLILAMLLGVLSTTALAGEDTGVSDHDENGYLTRAGLAVMLCANGTLNAAMQEKADKTVELNFSDIENCNEEQIEAITLVVQAGIMQGVKPEEDGTSAFNPSMVVTRASAAAIIWRILGSKNAEEQELPYSDISADHWYAPAINYLVAEGILTDKDAESTDEDGKVLFEPNKGAKPDKVKVWLDRIQSGGDDGGEDEVPEGVLTRAQLADMIYSNEKLKELIRLAAWGDTGELEFSDISGCTAAQKEAIYTMAEARVLNGNSDGTFAPNGTATRAQAAVVLWRAMGCRSNKEAVNLPYSDVASSQWYAGAINCLYALSILTEDDTLENEDFRVDTPIEAEELAAWLAAYDKLTDGQINDLTVGNSLSRAEMAVIFYNEYKAMLPDASGYTANFNDISGCTEEQKAVIGLFNSLELPNNGGAVVNGLGKPYIGDFAPFAAASNAQTVAILHRLLTWIEANSAESAEETAAETMSAGDGAVLRSTMVHYADAWYADALAFLTERGLTDAVETVNANPDAPAVESDLQSWSQALKPSAPTFSLKEGTYYAAQTVTLTAEDGAVIHYTTDGSAPTAASAVYSGAITVSSSMTIKAIAVKGALISDTASAAYTISTGGSSGSSSGSSSGGTASGTTYAVSVDTGRNGDVTVSPKSARKGDTVTITVKPDEGYEVDEIIVTDKNGDELKLTKKSGGKYTFTMPAGKVEVEVSFVKTEEEVLQQSFADIPNGYWAGDAIAWASENGYMNGNTADTFNPEGTVSRQQLWMILARLSGYRPADFAEAKSWAVDNGLSDGTIPGGAVSRQQLATILYRYAVRMGYKTSGSAGLTAYPDHASVAAYAADAMAWSVANSIVGGTTQGTLNPGGTATRAQFAVILSRFCENIVG